MTDHDIALLAVGAVAEGYLLLLAWFISYRVERWLTTRGTRQAIVSRAVTKSAARRNGANGQDKPKPQA
jgi:hypothetical protein